MFYTWKIQYFQGTEMVTSATQSAIEVAYWFFEQADDDGIYIEDEKLQHLLVLSQVHYAVSYNMEMLMPSLFVCDGSGFSEPTLRLIFTQGRPFMPKAKLPAKVTSFLKEIWRKYGKIPLKELTRLVKETPAYKQTYAAGAKNIVQFNSLVEKFITNSNIEKNNNAYSDNRKKVLLSQNGPVVVSKWQPRKVAEHTSKGEKNV